MPRSKKDKVVSLTKTGKRATRESKDKLIAEIQQQCDTFHYVWVFETEHMRNVHLQEVRKAWKPERMFLGKLAVMRKALGESEAEEHKAKSAQIASALHGNVGLLFTNSKPAVVVDWFASYSAPDFLRTGNTAPETITVPAGPVKFTEDGVAPHSIEPQLRKLGMPTKLVKGVPTLDSPYTICEKDSTLKPDQVNLLKLFDHHLAKFQIRPQVCLDLQTAEVTQAADVNTDEIDED